jgi:hypothetical protein
MKKLPRKYRDPLIFLSLLIIVPSSIFFISMNFGDQRLHIEKKQWNPATAADQGVDPQRLKRAQNHPRKILLEGRAAGKGIPPFTQPCHPARTGGYRH